MDAQNAVENPAVDHPSEAHAVPMKVLVCVFACLLALTALTVAVTRVNLGEGNVLIALAIAVAKAGLVAMYFMHLRYDHPFHGVVLVVALLFVALFIGMLVLDTGQYQADLQPPAGMRITP